MKRSKLVAIPQLFQKYQMMPDCAGHGGVLPIGDPELFGGLLNDPCERSIVSMANVRAEMMDDVMVKPAREEAHNWIFGCVISRCGEDVIHAVLELAALGGKIGGVNRVGGLENERNAQADDQMNEKKRKGDQERRFSQQ
jgi:hypothetical protein